MRYLKLAACAIVACVQLVTSTAPSYSEERDHKVTTYVVANRDVYGSSLLNQSRDPLCPLCYRVVRSAPQARNLERATRSPNSPSPTPASPKSNDGFVVKASWYGPGFHGRPRADTKLFDQNDPTIVAHRTLPFGTRLRATNLDNGKTIEVVVRDRGPYVDGRQLDFSRAGARALDFERKGTALIAVQIVSIPSNRTS